MLARSIGIGLAHYVNQACWFSKWIGFFQGEECRRSGHHAKEKIKPIYAYVAIIDPGCLLFGLELSLGTSQQLDIVLRGET